MNLFGLRSDDLWIIATAVCCNVACGLLGCFLVLRRLSLLGDAISHAILPGLALAFILTHSRAIGPILIGAMAVGLLTTLLTSLLHTWGKVPEDASMGVVFTSLFALGVLLITRAASNVDLDPGCVLYGAIEFVPFDTVSVFGAALPRGTLVLAGVMVAVVLLVILFFKELQIVSFDPYLATAMGINAVLVHYVLMAAVAATTVAAFESVGSILVVAMLIAPGATAHLLTDRLSRMLVIAAASAAVSAVAGYLSAMTINTSVAGMMSVVAGAQFALAVFFAPRYGFISKMLHRLQLSFRILCEDMLGLLYRWNEVRPDTGLPRPAALEALGRGAMPRLALRLLRGRREIALDPAGAIRLTPQGLVAARVLVRSHRLWESYLAKHLGLPADHVHEPAMRMEHYVDGALRERLEEQVDAASDPHGRDIPAP